MTAIAGFLTQYAWAGPVIVVVLPLIGGVIGFLVAQYWQRAEWGLKNRTVSLQELMAQKELYARLQTLQAQASDAITRYIPLRDKRFAESNATTAEEHEKMREVQRTYAAEKGKLLGLIREYKQLEAKLSTMEGRQPRWFVLPLPPMAPTGFRFVSEEEAKEGIRVGSKSAATPRDTLRLEVENDLRELYRQYGWEYPTQERKEGG